jgi:Patatin-like phospholipase
VLQISILARVTTLAVVAMTLAACSAISRQPVPEGVELDAVVAAPGPIRMWGDVLPKNLAAIRRELDAQRQANNFDPLGARNYLAVSGGGSDGAFGAGLLVGWSEAGTRPKFDVVTGISTGALIAPFAFLGSDYDAQLKEVYTTYGQKDIAQPRTLLSVAAEASIASIAPMVALVEHYVSSDFLAAVANEHRKGRRLLIGTTHLDAQRPVIWNMGEIAVRGDQNAIELFRKIIIASASVPGIFPPALISVDKGGRTYDEMHVDGGVVSQVFLFPTQFDPRSLDKRLGHSPRRRLFIIRNGRLSAEWETVEPSILKIAGRSISSLIKYQGRGDLDRMYFESRNYDVEFNLASIPESFTYKEKEPFDLTYMNALFDVGYMLGRNGYHWQKKPPDF